MNYYQTLGIDNTATQEEIKLAYRKLAKIHHPDKGGDVAKFQEIQSAYDVLSDPVKKRNYDNNTNGNTININPFDFFNFANSARFKQHHIYTVTLSVTLEQISEGSKETVNINTPTGPKIISVDIPQGIQDGQVVRYMDIMPDGELHIIFRVIAHPNFKRNGLDLYTEIDVNFLELILGTSIQVNDIYKNKLDVTIPPMTKPNTKLKLSGKGLRTVHNRGDQYIIINGKIPDIISETLLFSIKQEIKGLNK